MFATIRRYTIERGHWDDITQDIREGFLPLISDVPGFVSYDVLNAGDRLLTVSVFETREGADKSTFRAAEFVKRQEAFRLSKPEITEGEVTVHKAGERGIGASYTK
jgi:hypothetical protein